MVSCIDSYRGLGVKTDAECVVPVAFGHFRIGEVIDNFDTDSVLRSNDDSEFSFVFKEDSIAQLTIAELLELPASIELKEQSFKLGDIDVEPRVYKEHVSIDDLKRMLTSNTIIQDLPIDGSIYFPNIEFLETEDENMAFQIEEFDFMKQGHFSKGEIKVTFKNSFPTNCKLSLILFDENNSFKETLNFGFSTDDGVAPNETEVQSVFLKNKTIDGAIGYKVNFMSLSESSGLVNIQREQGMDFDFEMLNMSVYDGLFKSVDFSYESPIQYFDVELEENIELTSIAMNSGTLDLKLTKDFDFTGNVVVTIPSIQRNGKDLTLDIELGDNIVTDVFLDLTDTDVILNKLQGRNTLAYKISIANTSATEYVQLTAVDEISFEGAFKNYNIDCVEGDFGTHNFDVEFESIDLYKEFVEIISGEVFGDEPKLNIFFTNPIGIPFEFELVIDAYSRSGDSVRVVKEPFVLDYPKSIDDQPVHSSILFDTQNSTLKDFVTLPPDSFINFYAKATMNPYSEGHNENFLLMNEPVSIGVEFEVPILLKGKIFNYIDTIALSTIDLDESVEDARLIFQSQNTVPLQVDFNVQAFDSLSGNVLGEEMFVTILGAALTDPFGNVIDTTFSENVLDVDVTNIDALSNANSLIVRASFMSPESGTNPAKLSDDQSFDVKVVLDVKPTGK